jgi:hypothetical protein
VPAAVTLEYYQRMTIREHLQRLENYIGYGTVAVGVAIFLVWHSQHPNVSKDASIRWMLWMSLPLVAAMITLFKLFCRCPQCHTSRLKVEQVQSNPDRYRVLRAFPEACPRCHASFNESWK